MTDGERMIWAAAYADYLREYMLGAVPPDSALHTPDGLKRWERNMVISAAEWAWGCVGNLRDAQQAIEDKLIPAVSNMARCMLEVTP